MVGVTVVGALVGTGTVGGVLLWVYVGWGKNASETVAFGLGRCWQLNCEWMVQVFDN